MTLQDLWEVLDRHADEVPIDELTELLGHVELTADKIRDHVRFDSDRYQRNLLHCGAGYCAVVICWLPGQSSPIHDHRGSACAVRVLEGVASETKYAVGPDGALVETSRCTYPTGHVCGSWDADIHAMFNEQPEGNNLVTLHIYTPPLREIRQYELDGSVETWTDEMSCSAQARVLAAERARAAAAVTAAPTGAAAARAGSPPRSAGR